MGRGGRAGQFQSRLRGEGFDSGKRTREGARRAIMNLITRRGLPHNLADVAVNFFTIAQRGSLSALVPNEPNFASSASFLAGRTLESVAACCLYIACRKREAPRDAANADAAASLMLIDLAEIIDMNVFLLGKTFTRLVKHIWGSINPDTGRKTGQLEGQHSLQLLASPPESLVERFVNELEFDRRDQAKIKSDAVNIVRRMKRDWMHYGRRPAGVCGAAVILAARMNNYRRTIREVVLVAKVTEITIGKRLEEFKFTQSSSLSLEDFRDEGARNALHDTDPPAFYTGQGVGPFIPANRKRKRGRPRKNPQPDTAAEIEGGEGDSNTPARPQVRFDKDGFRIPDLPSGKAKQKKSLPIDPRLLGNGATNGNSQGDAASSDSPGQADGNDDGPSTRTRSRRGRPLGVKNKPTRQPTESELELEKELDADVRYGLGLAKGARSDEVDADDSGEYLDQVDNGDEDIADDQTHNPSAPVEKAWSKAPSLKGPPANSSIGNTGAACSMSPTLRPEEFVDDMDVDSCILSEAEMRIKERIWVTENADWLRKDNEKKIQQTIKALNVARNGGDSGKAGKGKRKKRAGRLGDVTYLDEDSGGEDGGKKDRDENGEGKRRRRERSATEAMEKMLARRAPSRRVNYQSLEEIYGRGRTSSRSSSVSMRQRGGSVTSVAAGGGGEQGSTAESITKTNDPTTPANQTTQEHAAAPPPSTRPRPPLPSPPQTQQSKALSPSLSPAPSITHAPTSTAVSAAASVASGEEEMLGSISDDEEANSSHASVSQIYGVSRHDSNAADDEDESDDDDEGEEDDYVDNTGNVDLDAIFGGRTRSGR